MDQEIFTSSSIIIGDTAFSMNILDESYNILNNTTYNLYDANNNIGTFDSVFLNLPSDSNSKIYNLANDSFGNIYFTDASDLGVFMIDVNGSSITNISPHNGDISYQYPSSVAIDCSDNIYVLDSERKEVILLNPSGEFTEILITHNNPQNTFQLPTAITMDPSNNLYIFDTTTDDSIAGSIYKYDHQNLLKISPKIIGGVPDISYGLSYSMTFFNEKLYIMDAELKCIIRIEPDGNNPVVITTNINDQNDDINPIEIVIDDCDCQCGDGDNLFQPIDISFIIHNPYAIANDYLGNIYVADTNKIYKIDGSGNLIKTFTANNSNLNSDDFLCGIVVDNNLNIYCSNYPPSGNEIKKIPQVFQFENITLDAGVHTLTVRDDNDNIIKTITYEVGTDKFLTIYFFFYLHKSLDEIYTLLNERHTKTNLFLWINEYNYYNNPIQYC